jgi:hypothetical protein
MKTTLCLALLTLPISVNAGNGTQLSDLVVKANSATGQCGVAKVSVAGLTQTDASGHTNVIRPSGQITITAGGKSVIVGKSEPMFLQDRTMVGCVDTPKGKRLLVATFCDGRGCEPVQYLIIDPTSLLQLTLHLNEPCTLHCVEHALKTSVPVPLRDGP